jgi:hypothetical protein
MKKPHGRSQNRLTQTPAMATLAELARRDRSKPIDPVEMIFDIAVGKMMQRMLQASNRAIDDDFLVRVGTSPGPAVAPEKPHVVVWIPAATPPPTP